MKANKVTNFSKGTIILTIILVITALLSIFVISRIVTAPEFNASTIKSLDDKKVIVMRLAATAAASSTAISLIPGDAAMPIANQIAELTSYFIVILGAILLEKMLIAVVGYVSFTYIIPISCFGGICYLHIKNNTLRNYALKLSMKFAIFGIALFVAIPVSVKVSDLIYDSYQASIEQSVEIVEQNNKYIEEKKEDLSSEDKNWVDQVSRYISNLTSKIGSGMSEMVKKGEDSLSTFLEAIAVLIITTCVIPIVVILIFVWIIKSLSGFDIIGESTVLRKKQREKELWDKE